MNRTLSTRLGCLEQWQESRGPSTLEVIRTLLTRLQQGPPLVSPLSQIADRSSEDDEGNPMRQQTRLVQRLERLEGAATPDGCCPHLPPLVTYPDEPVTDKRTCPRRCGRPRMHIAVVYEERDLPPGIAPVVTLRGVSLRDL